MNSNTEYLRVAAGVFGLYLIGTLYTVACELSLIALSCLKGEIGQMC